MVQLTWPLMGKAAAAAVVVVAAQPQSQAELSEALSEARATVSSDLLFHI